MTTTSQEALQKARDALQAQEELSDIPELRQSSDMRFACDEKRRAAIATIDAAISQQAAQEQKSVVKHVATVNDKYSRDGYNDEISTMLPVGTLLYAAAPAKPAECANGCPAQQVCDYCQGTGGIDKPAEQDPPQEIPCLNGSMVLQPGAPRPGERMRLLASGPVLYVMHGRYYSCEPAEAEQQAPDTKQTEKS